MKLDQNNPSLIWYGEKVCKSCHFNLHKIMYFCVFLMYLAFAKKHHDWITPDDHIFNILLALTSLAVRPSKHIIFLPLRKLEISKGGFAHWWAIWAGGTGLKGPGVDLRGWNISLFYLPIRDVFAFDKSLLNLYYWNPRKRFIHIWCPDNACLGSLRLCEWF